MTQTILQKAELPKFQRIRSWLLEKLSTGDFEIGDRFYTETSVAAELKMAPMTVRRAFKMLEDEKYVSRKGGSGTYVTRVPDRPIRFKVTESCNIGILIHDMDKYETLVFSPILTELIKQVNSYGYITIISIDSATRLIESQVDGIVVFGPPSEVDKKILKKSKIPLVAYGRWSLDKYPCVYQHMDAIKNNVALEFLNKGRRNIAVLYVGNEDARAYAHKSYMSPILNGIEKFGEGNAVLVFSSKEMITKTVEDLFNPTNKNRPDALFIASGFEISGVIQILERLKIRFPRDIGIISNGGGFFELNTDPAISMLKIDYYYGIKRMTDMLFKMISNHNYLGEKIKNRAVLTSKTTL